MSEPPALEARALTVARGAREVLSSVSLSIHGGELVAVLGPNGSGKSTLVGALAGDLAPRSGEVRAFGRALSQWPPRELAMRRAVARQDTHLALPFRVLEVVLLGRAPHPGRGDSAADHEAALRALESFDLKPIERRPYAELSGGERQRVQLARTLAQLDGSPGARALLLDEPTASLDPAHQLLALEHARRLADDGAAVLVVLHDLTLAARVASRLVVLGGGRVVRDGEPAEVLCDPAVHDAFGVRLELARVGERPVVVVG